ncbi:hypothetical protein ISCGN_031420 [Ixodes scapularis]
MPKYCAAEGCGNSVVRCETSAHTFPKDEKLRYLWSRLARPSFPTWVPSKSDRLCSEHFRDEDYIRSPSALKSVHLPTKHNRLNPGALPSVFSKKRKPEDLAEHIEKRRKVTPPCDAARSLEEEDDTWGNTEFEVVEQSSAKSVTLDAAAGGQLAAAASPAATALTDSPRTPSAASARGQLAAAVSPTATALTDSPRTPSAASARGQLAAAASPTATALTDSPRTPSAASARGQLAAVGSLNATALTDSPRTPSAASARGQLAAAASPTATALTDSPRTPSAASARGQLAAAASPTATALTDSPRTPSAASARGHLAAVGSLNATALTDSPRTPSAASARGQLAAVGSLNATALTDSPRTPSAASARGQLAAVGSLNATALTDSPRTPSAASARGQLAAVGSLNATALTDSPRTPSVTQACIKPPSRTRFVQTDVSGTMVWCSSPSHGDDALDTDLDLSDLCPPRAEADSSYCLSEDSFASPEKEAPSLVHERKFIVFESCLDQLLETCRSCAAPNTHIDKTVQGSSLQVSTLCRSGHTETWCSQPVIRRKPVGNILVAAAILFTGCSIKKAPRMLSSMGIACFCYKTFFIIQKAFLLPAIEKVWNKHQLELVSAAAGRQLVIAGDGRADSPGHSAKYGTYTMLDVEDNKVLHVETVQSNETGGSYHMELEGLRRSLDIFEAHSLVVAVLVTDRHPQLSAWLEREHPDICHLFDCWHVAKEYVGELMDAVLDISTVMPSYKAAAAHYCRDAPPFLSSAYERADKRALAENHYSRFNS